MMLNHDTVYTRRELRLDGVEEQPRPRRDRFFRTSATMIMSKTFDPIRWAIPGYVPEGFSVLAGRQKLGKTWLALDWAIAKAVGDMAMGGIPCIAGDVLYLDLENGERRIQRRLTTLFPDERSRPDLGRLEFVNDAPILGKEFIAALDEWRVSVPLPSLVVIDVLQKVKPPGNAARNAYENDYTAWGPIQKWATGHGIAVVGLHHTRKGGADDPLESLSGSNGLSACADTTIVLDRDANGMTLYVRGRDVEEVESALRIDSGIVTLMGNAAQVRMSDEQRSIIEALTDADEPLSPTEISDATRMPNTNVRQLLVTMAKSGTITKVKRGKYALPGKYDPEDGLNRHHKDHKITNTGPGDDPDE